MAENAFGKLLRLFGGLVIMRGPLGYRVLGQLLNSNSTSTEVAGGSLVLAAASLQPNANAQFAVRTMVPALVVDSLGRKQQEQLEKKRQELVRLTEAAEQRSGNTAYMAMGTKAPSIMADVLDRKHKREREEAQKKQQELTETLNRKLEEAEQRQNLQARELHDRRQEAEQTQVKQTQELILKLEKTQQQQEELAESVKRQLDNAQRRQDEHRREFLEICDELKKLGERQDADAKISASTQNEILKIHGLVEKLGEGLNELPQHIRKLQNPASNVAADEITGDKTSGENSAASLLTGNTDQSVKSSNAHDKKTKASGSKTASKKRVAKRRTKSSKKPPST